MIGVDWPLNLKNTRGRSKIHIRLMRFDVAGISERGSRS